LQAVGSLCAIATCLVVVAVPPGVTAVNVTSYSPSNVKRADTLSPLNFCPVLVSQYAMELPGVLLTHTTVLASSPVGISNAGVGTFHRSCFSSRRPCTAMVAITSLPAVVLGGCAVIILCITV